MKRAFQLVLILIVSALLGGLTGEILAIFLPDGVMHDIVTKSFDLGVSPSKIDLRVFTFTVGFSVRITSLFVVGFLTGAFLCYKFSR